MNKKLELDLGEKTYQLWFNNYAIAELQKMYGVKQNEIMNNIIKRGQENYFLLISDLVKAGIKGYALAKEETTPKINIQELVGEADQNELVKILEVFYDVMGVNIEKDDKKKVKKSPKVKS